MKLCYAAGAFLMAPVLSAQEIEPKFEIQGELIKGTYYYENGSVRQEGTYKGGKLHGEWVSFDQSGKKNALARYEEGVKMGKWFFWSPDVLTEVEYRNNVIAEVTEYKRQGILITRN
ncbi:nicotinic acid mononucleotide adenyltransferase [Antarcticibacterium arcticum]|uniref:Nicotinic acid mononucleotide adenyltransferase n=2 Tax=Antarcticibacterium arcticum TaxID=2585771 RepID=A0A5B8YME7_9FLAO|nr:nicotinic acid mononucleotide adenyltransferase [Antarcticibacterium arcticum]